MLEPMFNPRLTYWATDAGTVFSGPKQKVITTDDADYVAFLGGGYVARSWPRDADGLQTIAALQDVLSPYGMFADLRGYAAHARWVKETSWITVTLSTGESVPVSTARGDDRDGLRDAFLGVQSGMRVDGSVFKFPDGVSRPVSNADIVSITTAAFLHVQAAFDREAAVAAAIVAETITTIAEVDAAFA